MKTCRKLLSGHAYIPALLSAFLLAACGQTGELYMPQKHATPPPPPRTSTIKKAPENTAAQPAAAPTEKNYQRN